VKKYHVLNKYRTFYIKIFLHYVDITILVLVYFILTHPVDLK